MKTPDEIKKGLEICASAMMNQSCVGCPWHGKNDSFCNESVMLDALAYIQQLETERHQLERERDAAVEVLSMSRPCEGCKYKDLPGFDEPCSTCICNAQLSKPNWEWRGVKEE